MEPCPRPGRRRRVGGQQRWPRALEGGRHEHRLYDRRRSTVQPHAGPAPHARRQPVGSGRLRRSAHYAGRRRPGPGPRLRRARWPSSRRVPCLHAGQRRLGLDCFFLRFAADLSLRRRGLAASGAADRRSRAEGPGARDNVHAARAGWRALAGPQPRRHPAPG